MDTVQAAAVWTRHEARPGRRALVISDLGELRGPAGGPVELPVWLFWSSPDRTFDLDEPFMLRSMYETVLGQADRPEDLAGYLNGELLISVWPQLFLPRGVRRAWEEHHPVLRALTAAA